MSTNAERSVINKIKKVTDKYDKLKSHAKSTRPSIVKKRTVLAVKLEDLFNIVGIIPDNVSKNSFEFYCKSYRKSSTCSSLPERIPPKPIDPISFEPLLTSEDDDDDDLQPVSSSNVPKSSTNVITPRLFRQLAKKAAEKQKIISLTGVEERRKKLARKKELLNNLRERNRQWNAVRALIVEQEDEAEQLLFAKKD